jgi:uncharacterized membrane protein YGL010W
MQNLQYWLDEYGASHTNLTNKLIHWVCVPVINWTVIAFLWAIPFPDSLQSEAVPINWAVIGLILAQLYYFRLSVRLGTGLLLFNLLLLWLTSIIDTTAAWPLWLIALIAFVLAWIVQFIGHMVEGKRPSFLKDVQFLMIGPAWLMAFIYRSLGVKT